MTLTSTAEAQVEFLDVGRVFPGARRREVGTGGKHVVVRDVQPDLPGRHARPARHQELAHLVPAMVKTHGNIYVKDVIPQRMYKGMEKDNQAATVTNLLTVHDAMDPKLVYNIVKTLWESRVDLVRVHAEAVNLKPENQRADASSIPWHPQAIKYFAEQGIKIK